MQLRKSAIFFCIAIAISLVLNVCLWAYSLVSYPGNLEAMTLLSWALAALTMIGFILVGAGLMRRGAVNTGIVWAVIALVFVEFCFGIYQQYRFYHSYTFSLPLRYLIQFIIGLFKDLALMGFLVAFALGAKFRSASVVWLFVAGLIAMALMSSFLINVDYYSQIVRDLEDGFRNWIYLLMNISGLLFPLSLVLLSLALDESDAVSDEQLLTGRDELLDGHLDEEQAVVSASGEEVSLKRWIYYVYFSSIPVFGLVLLTFWIAKKGNLARTNWAFGRSVVSILGTILVLLWLYSRAYNPGQTFMWIIIALLVLLMVMAILWQNRENKTTEDDWEADTVGGWIGRHLVAGIPLVGLILLIVWVSSSENLTRRRWAGAQLIASGIWTLTYLWTFQDTVERFF